MSCLKFMYLLHEFDAFQIHVIHFLKACGWTVQPPLSQQILNNLIEYYFQEHEFESISFPISCIISINAF